MSGIYERVSIRSSLRRPGAGETNAVSIGGHLASVNSKPENLWLIVLGQTLIEMEVI